MECIKCNNEVGVDACKPRLHLGGCLGPWTVVRQEDRSWTSCNCRRKCVVRERVICANRKSLRAWSLQKAEGVGSGRLVTDDGIMLKKAKMLENDMFIQRLVR